ncbi:hypothetical protein AB1K70_14765 [Bremerella sp. JC770]|uniref:hypothetical protein n=1 Tax=Bremerella sp. JC770 TaxID=3232137 RepID=UPI003458A425
MDHTERKRQPQVSLVDLLAGMLVAAIWCAANQKSFANLDLSQNLANMLFQFGLILIYFFGATGLCLFVRRWYLGMVTDFQPGHWWLCLVGILVVYVLLAVLVEWNVVPLNELDRTWKLKWLFGQGAGYIGVLWISGLLLPVRRAWWLTLIPQTLVHLGTMALWAAVLAGYTSYGVYYQPRFQFFSLPLALVLLWSVAIWDARTTPDRRDWLHWFGLVVASMVSGNELINRILHAFS